MRIKPFTFGLLVLLGFALLLPALDPQKALSQYMLDVWQTEDGLPSEVINAIAQTPDGYLWLGTEGGLVRFNGVTFKVFNSDNTPEIPDNSISSLLVDSAGDLWIGMDSFGGLARLHYGQFTNFISQDGLSNMAVTSICQDREGTIWVGTWNGLNRLKNGKFLPAFFQGDGLADNVVYSLCAGSSGAIWIGSWGGGLSRFRNGRFTIFGAREGLLNSVVWSIFEDREKRLWVLTKGGLNRYVKERFAGLTSRNGLAHDYVRSVCQDRQGSLWFGTWGGLNRLNGNRFQHISTRDGLSNNIVRALFEDAEGNLWVGTWGGLNRIRDGKFTVFGSKEGLPTDLLRPVYCDPDGTVWAGSDEQGLSCLRQGVIEHYPGRFGLLRDHVTAILKDARGRLWVGGENALICFNNGKVEESPAIRHDFPGNMIRALFQDRAGNIWVALERGGLRRYGPDGFSVNPVPDGLPTLAANVIVQDSQGGMWIGSEHGLFLNRDGKVSRFTTKEGLANNSVLVVYPDGQGIVWIGTDGGLSRFQNGKLFNFANHFGFSKEAITEIIEDAGGTIWLGTYTGIWRVSRQQLEDVANGIETPISCRKYGISDGMRSERCLAFNQPIMCKNSQGKLWFPTAKGIVMVDPGHIKYDSRPPPVVIEDVLVDDRSGEYSADHLLSRGSKKIEFRFAVLSFSPVHSIRCKFSLGKDEKNWQEDLDATRLRRVIFRDIPPGHYRFRIIADNGDEVWNHTGASFDFTLQPFFYQTIWFKLGILFFFTVGLSVALIRYRTGKRPYRRSSLNGEAVNALFQTLLNRMEKEKPFLDSDLTLQSLAKQLLISIHHLSQVINEKTGKNFNEFINSYRIERAKHILAGPESGKDKLLKIAFEVGFNNKTSFNQAFKKNTGLTPKEFRTISKKKR